MHAEITAKVNALVDKGIAPLVEALSRFDRILTASSCQGGGGRPAYVWFHVVGNESEAPKFVWRLAQEIGRHCQGGPQYCLQLEWCSGNESPLAKIESPPEAISRLAEVVGSIANDDRMKPYLYGTGHKEPRS